MVDYWIAVDPESPTRPGGLPPVVRVYDEHLPVRLSQGALENLVRSLFVAGPGTTLTIANGIVTINNATGYTATDAELRARSSHTGTQLAATVSDFTEAAQDAASSMFRAGVGVSFTYDDVANTFTINASGGTGGTTDPEIVRDVIGSALIGSGRISIVVNDAGDAISIATTATMNSTDAALRDRATHTGFQEQSTVTGLTAELASNLTVRGEFAVGVSYAVNDLVHVGAESYYARQAHVSTSPAPTGDSAFWKKIGGSGGGSPTIANVEGLEPALGQRLRTRGAFTAGTDYKVNDVVAAGFAGEMLAICRLDHVASGIAPTKSNTYWWVPGSTSGTPSVIDGGTPASA